VFVKGIVTSYACSLRFILASNLTSAWSTSNQLTAEYERYDSAQNRRALRTCKSGDNRNCHRLSCGNGLPGKVGEEAWPAAEFFDVEEPELEAWNFTWCLYPGGGLIREQASY
jgi:hypothetical protein